MYSRTSVVIWTAIDRSLYKLRWENKKKVPPPPQKKKEKKAQLFDFYLHLVHHALELNLGEVSWGTLGFYWAIFRSSSLFFCACILYHFLDMWRQTNKEKKRKRTTKKRGLTVCRRHTCSFCVLNVTTLAVTSALADAWTDTWQSRLEVVTSRRTSWLAQLEDLVLSTEVVCHCHACRAAKTSRKKVYSLPRTRIRTVGLKENPSVQSDMAMNF